MLRRSVPPRRDSARPPLPSLVRRIPLNERGRDFVVGDIHGAYELVVECLRTATFDPRVDRLFSVGDTVDRGPDSRRALRFLATSWVHAIRGNHEAMILDLYEDGEPDEAVLRLMTSHNGAGWWMALAPSERLQFVEAFRSMPIAMEIETRRGLVGLVHAEVPAYMDWKEFTERLLRGEDRTMQTALWGRDRIGSGDEKGVPGIGRVFVGHTPVDRPTRLGNVIYLDTGAVFGLLASDPIRGRLTMTDLACRTVVLGEEAPRRLVDVRTDDNPSREPFGTYART